ncbi:ABC transporter ATP-binding protein [Alcaligenes endophyticus]|uniref:ABC transporter ATP-binding protein n=1 Tax=Alcaligenes endophyticus TaxID=1929088 RepID=A0ABT8EGY9_9BURK|nr:ABC transporter ATP-binding protein [Alcaligenes endophyticus]MCX5589782.1 ABC transporter ATP-binding protein [Alcaligenes endophyticus]MDN4120555.1 ABC transporter ATP-binding protein [Alcaligenes endophyticus]
MNIQLSVHKLSRHFGGLKAIDNVSLHLQSGILHAVIGTNGAGKSTLINLISGELAPSQGQIILNEQDITLWSQPKRAKAGLGRSYQRTTLFDELSVYENCRLAAQAKQEQFWHWCKSAADCKQSKAFAEHALSLAGLSSDAHLIAGTLSHGRKRQLEIAMSLATQPSVLLLDEPLAGMGPEESEHMLSLLNKLKQEHAILLVEHDMDAVFKVADQITVMVNGQMLASGRPEAIRANPQVQEAYLGETA